MRSDFSFRKIESIEVTLDIIYLVVRKFDEPVMTLVGAIACSAA